MTLWTGLLGFLLLVAVIYIAVERLASWISRSGGFTIRIEVEEGED